MALTQVLSAQPRPVMGGDGDSLWASRPGFVSVGGVYSLQSGGHQDCALSDLSPFAWCRTC